MVDTTTVFTVVGFSIHFPAHLQWHLSAFKHVPLRPFVIPMASAQMVLQSSSSTTRRKNTPCKRGRGVDSQVVRVSYWNPELVSLIGEYLWTMDESNQNGEKSSKAPGPSESLFQSNSTCYCCWLKPHFRLKPLLDLRMFQHWKLLTHFSTFRDGEQHLSWRLPNAACRWNPAKAIGKRLDTSTCAKRRNNGGGNQVEQRRWGRQRKRFLGFAWKMIDSKGEVMRKTARVTLPKVHWNYSMLKNLKLVLTLDPQPTETAKHSLMM